MLQKGTAKDSLCNQSPSDGEGHFMTPLYKSDGQVLPETCSLKGVTERIYYAGTSKHNVLLLEDTIFKVHGI